MYKRFMITKKYSLTFNTFRKAAKIDLKVFRTGIRNWISDVSYNYSIVIGTFRIIFSIERQHYACCNSN
jgi:hypothetical protein